jgi:hypothetical protein
MVLLKAVAYPSVKVFCLGPVVAERVSFTALERKESLSVAIDDTSEAYRFIILPLVEQHVS